MKPLVRSSVALVLAVTALALPAGAAAAPASTTFAISGNEYAFTSTVGSFAGTGHGIDGGDRAAWNTSVQHDPLGSVPTWVNGGSFQMTTVSPTGHVDSVTGTFAYHGGMITPIPPPGPGCRNQQFQVTGTLQGVATNTSSGGSGTFSAVLTHYRISLFGQCFIYNARVAGTVSFTY